LDTRVPSATIAIVAGAEVAPKDIPIGAGGIESFIAAELILTSVQVASETVGDGAGLLRMRVSTTQAHGVNKYVRG